MKAFRDAVLLRHVNLFHQTRFEEERAALQINTSDIDNMTSDLLTRPDGLGRDADDMHWFRWRLQGHAGHKKEATTV